MLRSATTPRSAPSRRPNDPSPSHRRAARRPGGGTVRRPIPSPEEQALSTRFVFEISTSLQCSAGLIAAQAGLAKACERVKELEAAVPEPEPAEKQEAVDLGPTPRTPVVVSGSTRSRRGYRSASTVTSWLPPISRGQEPGSTISRRSPASSTMRRIRVPV